MAKAKTGAFYLTEQVILSNNLATQGTISLASYIDVASRQGIAIEQVDFMYQSITGAGVYSNSVENINSLNTAWTATAQVTDVNRGVNVVSAADRALIGSGSLVHATTNGVSNVADVYPDNYGSVALDEARIVVNDQLFFTAECDGDFALASNMPVTVRLKCRIVKLTERDFMAIAITSSAADN